MVVSGREDAGEQVRNGQFPAIHESWLPTEHPLYRPRHHQQRLARICALIFLVVPAVAYLAGLRPTVSENHAPAAFPGVGAGWSFFTGLSAWATDSFPFRDEGIAAENGLSRSVFGEPPQYGQSGGAGPLDLPTPTNQPPVRSGGERAGNGFQTVIEGKGGWLYYGYDVEAKCNPEQPLDEVVRNVQALRNAIESSGRKFVLIVAPDKTTMLPQYLPDTYAGKSCAAAATTAFWQRATTDLGVVDLRQPLADEAGATGTPIYFRQDTHWTFAGGLTMVRQMANQVEPGTASTWRVLPGPTSTGPADLPTLIGRTGTDRTEDYHLAPDGVHDRTMWTSVDFHRTRMLTSDPIEGTVTTSTALIGDSFTQFAYPYLAATFSHLSVTHLDTLGSDPTAVADAVVNSDTVVIEVVERYLAAGVSPVSDPQVISVISAAMAAHPIK